jgi:cobaltochelatase CobT
MNDSAVTLRERRVRELHAASVRALSDQRDVHFRGPVLYRGRRRVPMPAPHLHPNADRGAADGMALRLRHHDPDVHAALVPERTASRLVFEMLEQFRVESLVPASWPGVRHNLTERFRGWSQALEASRSVETASSLLLYTIAQVCRSRITAEPIADSAQHLIEQVRFGLASTIGHELALLRPNRHCQRTFGAHARLIAERVADLPQLQMQPGERDAQPDAFVWLFDAESDDDATPPPPGGPRRGLDSRAADYRAFTRSYDETRGIESLARPAQLREYRERLDRAIEASEVSSQALVRRLTDLLTERRTDGWEGSRDCGRVDGRRLAQLVTTPSERNIFRAEASAPRTDVVVSFLVDCSGSMKAFSEPVGVLVDVFARALELAGAGCEILGFTTASWNGGRVRRDWIRSGRPRNPGRLNEVRHLVIKSADTPYRSARTAIAGLLKLDLYREGVDGEAVEWARARLAARDEQRRILAVISDGSPMDGATCLANGENYLDRHLRDVLATESEVEICAIGVGLDLSIYYDRCAVLDLSRGTRHCVLSEVAETIALGSRGGHYR